jgi:mono/diheme cytochrome c family protein
MKKTIAGLLSMIALAALTQSAGAADASNGERLAKRWCATCHVVAADQKRANGDAAPFSTIGKTPGLDSAKLALFLLLPHPNMPDMHLSRAEAADLAAYIVQQGR